MFRPIKIDMFVVAILFRGCADFNKDLCAFFTVIAMREPEVLHAFVVQRYGLDLAADAVRKLLYYTGGNGRLIHTCINTNHQLRTRDGRDGANFCQQGHVSAANFGDEATKASQHVIPIQRRSWGSGGCDTGGTR